MIGGKQKLLLRALAGERLPRPPWWLMRQAGRYLPEYRELRAKAGDFITLCLTPEHAVEATLQPIRRYGMDAAILFSDILLVPRALGQGLGFHNDGPVLDRLEETRGLCGLDLARSLPQLEPGFEAARRCRAALPPETALIGFAGAPWTVATYMVEGGASKDYRRVKSWSYRDPVGFAALIDLITEATVEFLVGQVEAGVDAIQLFDSWAGVLSEPGFERWSIAPTRRIVMALKQRFPELPIIGFPRGAGLFYRRYAEETGVAAVSLDTSVPLDTARQTLQNRVVVQGNLDPVLLLVGGAPMEEAAMRLRHAFAGGAHIFNLGHGVLPQTPPEHVKQLARLLSQPVDAG